MDLAGNNLATTFNSIFTIDTVPPKVTSIDPANNAVINNTGKIITISFSKPIQQGSAFKNVKMVNGSGGVVTIQALVTNNILTITRTVGNYPNGYTYNMTLPINSVKDMAGNGLASIYNSNFTIDTVPPKVTSIDPANNAINVTTTHLIKITYSEPIMAGSAYANIVLKNSTGTSISINKSISGNVLTISLPTGTTYTKGMKYTLTLPVNSVKDQANNSITTTNTTTFTTTTV